MMTSSWLLAGPYLAAAGAMMALAWAMGRPVVVGMPLSDAPRAAVSTFRFGLRIAFGLAVLSWISAIAGVSGWFSWPVVLVMAAPVAAVAAFFPRRSPAGMPPSPHKSSEPPHRRPPPVAALTRRLAALPLPERLLALGVALLFLLLCANALIGAMVPDMNQDPLWYHLSVPRQWVFDGRFAVYPSVMPSAYPLAAEALFALIFLVKADPVLCSALVAAAGIVLITNMLAATALALGDTPRAKWGISAVVCLLVPCVAVYGLMAPVQPKNDLLVMLWAFTGALTLWLPLLRSQCFTAGQAGVSGVLLGTACCGKPIVLAVSGMVVFGALVQQYRIIWSAGDSDRNVQGTDLTKRPAGSAGLRACMYNQTRLRPTFRPVVAFTITWIIAALPWLYRGYSTHGLPLFPLFQRWFPINPDYQPTIDAFNHTHTLPGVADSTWLQTLAALPGTIARAATFGEEAIYLLIISAMLGLALTRGSWRVFSAVVAAQVLVVAAGNGQPVIYRLLAPAYCIAAPLAGYLAAAGATAIHRRTRLLVGAIVLALTIGAAVTQQATSARLPTFNWRFTPVLSAADVLAYSRHAEHGHTYTSFAAARQAIAPRERVLLLGSHYPFYLQRSALWNDEVVTSGGLQERWTGFSVAEAEHFIQANDVDVVLYASDHVSTRTAADLVDAGTLRPAQLPDELRQQGWSLYRRTH